MAARRVPQPVGCPLRDAAARARAAGNTQDTFAALEAANHVSPGDPDVLRGWSISRIQLGDHTAAARHLIALSHVASGTKKGDALLQLADMYSDELDDIGRARQAMREAAEAFGAGTRSDGTLRMLASEAASHLAWDVTVDALSAIAGARAAPAPMSSDSRTALVRAGKPGDALQTIEDATAQGRFDRRRHAARRAPRGDRAQGDTRPCTGGEGNAPHHRRKRARCAYEAAAPVGRAIGGVQSEVTERVRANPRIVPAGRTERADTTGTPAENEERNRHRPRHRPRNRDRLLAAHREAPRRPGILLALLDELGDRDPVLRRELLESGLRASSGRPRRSRSTSSH